MSGTSLVGARGKTSENVDIKSSAHDTFLEKPSSSTNST